MVHEPSGVALTYNGEVYNFVELRQSLESDGYRFISNSDTEVVLAASVPLGQSVHRALQWDVRVRHLGPS